MPLLIDLHTHTFPKSDDSLLQPEELFRKAKEVGLDGICLTEHDGFWETSDLVRWSNEFDILIVPGCEVTTEEGHLLVFGLDRYIFGMHRAKFVKELVDQNDGVIVVAHPYRRVFQKEAAQNLELFEGMVQKACDNPAFGMANGVEVLNARGSQEENWFSSVVQERVNLPATGASDAHQLSDIGTFATEFNNPVGSLRDLIIELQRGNVSPATIRTPWIPKTFSP
ncbi:PHP domain-containing protein [SAR202 cluster bacterium AD-802-E10_MRT_200m]|nr:PHP domain-containing protein [SAR202 cluster bacterium AD-802-E10_MRT_200m]